jgi:glucose/arabinose dehydrogenase
MKLITFLSVLLAALPSVSAGATIPSGFTETQVASGLSSPTAMQFAPDGRLFICEQAGRLRVVKNGTLLGTPFLSVTVSSSGERGLLGVAFDPGFATNQYVYIYYTATSPAVHNRISRFTANGDVALAGSEVVIFELDNLSTATNHNGGALAFGADGKLYAAVGENANGANAQSMTNVLGKMLRINSDGSIPTDNPFYASTSGKNRAIWALGLRNPFTFAFNPSGGEMFINDVGQNTWEEINDGIAGSNYGWPDTEGATTDPRFRTPRLSYNHSGGACAITGGAFYSPLSAQFPSEYSRDYFFADYCGGWIRKLDTASGGIAAFASGIAAPVDLKVSDAGALYYLARGTGGATGVVYRIEYGAAAPSITSHPSNRTSAPGGSVTFSVRASGPAPLRYQWRRDGVDIAGATAADYTIGSVAQSDSGARFRALVTNDFGNALSNEAVLTVTANQAPAGTITQPSAGTLYSGGQVIDYAGSATDAEDGALPPSAFTWRVDFHHDTHTHPFIASTSGATSGSFTIPDVGETSANVWYRIYLTVRDSGGLTHTTQRDIMPRKVRLTLATNPAGLQLKLDGQPAATPLSFDSVVGVMRTIEAPSPQTSGGTTYTFASWSDGGAANHSVRTPTANTTYTATYTATGAGGANGLSATYFDNSNLTGATVSRVDAAVDFIWGSASPAPGIGAETFSVRWTGQIEPQFSETYRFYTISNDGVRLWVNGVRVVSNWTNHGTTENSGTIALAGGQRYAITMEFYEDTGNATARLLWSSPSTPKAVVPSARLFTDAAPPPPPTAIRVNFQTASAPVPAGYLKDGGLAFGDRGNGQSYGWNADNTAQMRDRNSAVSPDQRYDTLAYMQRPANPDAVWEIAVPNGSYVVRLVAGDAAYYDTLYKVAVEGVLTVDGTSNSASRWVEGTSTVTVADGRLTIGSAAGATANKICFVDITPQ